MLIQKRIKLKLKNLVKNIEKNLVKNIEKNLAPYKGGAPPSDTLLSTKLESSSSTSDASLGSL